ncbi:hypothetical protein DV736_g4585, partial [Chaetothyriales sp. CBS 134916]
MDEPVLSPPIEGADLVTQALEIIKSIEKSIQLQLTVRRASVDIQDSLQSLEVIKYLLEGFVSAVRRSHSHGSQPSDAHIFALHKFSKGLIALDDIIKSCEDKMAVSERRFLPFNAKLGYALNNKQQNTLRQWVESAKVHFTLPLEEDPRNLLLEALTSSQDRREVGNHQAPAHIDTPNLRAGNISQSLQTTPKGPRKKYITTYKLGIAELAITKSDQDKETLPARIDDTAFEITLSFAPWLLNRAYTLATYQSQQGWTRMLRSTIYVSPNDDIFWLCAKGDAPGVRKLIADGRASPHSVTYHDITPLIVAAKNHHATVVQVLLDLHADVDHSTALSLIPELCAYEMTPLSWAIHYQRLEWIYSNIPNTWKWRNTDATAFRDTIRALVEQGHSTLDAEWELIHDQEEDILQVDSEGSIFGSFGQLSVDDFNWLTEPGRFGYWGSDLQDFYISVLYRLLNEGSQPGIVLAAFSKISDTARLVKSRSAFRHLPEDNLIDNLLDWMPLAACIYRQLDSWTHAWEDSYVQNSRGKY